MLKMKRLGPRLVPVLLLLFVAAGNAASVYQGRGEWVIANISPEVARVRARDQAYLDIVQQATGIDISSSELLVNETMASCHVLHTPRARVINPECRYRTEQRSEWLVQYAECRGEVQEFGEHGPRIRAALARASEARGCAFDTLPDFENEEWPLFRAGERFCLLLRSMEPVHVGVFGAYEDRGELRISRLFPSGDRPALRLDPGDIPRLTPLSSAPLSGEALAQESLFIVASREAIDMRALLPAESGFSAVETAERSVPMREFDRALSGIDLDRVNIVVLEV